MVMKPGASGSENTFSGSLAESIENAFKVEWLMAKGEPLPDDGRDDRRLLFAALAQGILNYLKDNDGDFKLLVDSDIQDIYIQSPHLDVQPTGVGSSQVHIEGEFFSPNGRITLIWDEPLTTYDFQAGWGGGFDKDFDPPADAAAGKHIVEARDDAGHVAFAVFVKP
jgi:hypothetical protein